MTIEETNKSLDALKIQTITVEVDPIQMSVLMDVVAVCFPEIRMNFEENLSQYVDIDLDAVERTIIEVQLKCFEQTDLFEEAKSIINKTGKIPDIKELIEWKAAEGAIVMSGGYKTVIVDVAPFYAMFAMFIARGYFEQFEKIIFEHFSEHMLLSFPAMRKSVDEIYEKSIARTEFREGASQWLEILRMTGTLPGGRES